LNAAPSKIRAGRWSASARAGVRRRGRGPAAIEATTSRRRASIY